MGEGKDNNKAEEVRRREEEKREVSALEVDDEDCNISMKRNGCFS